MLAEITRRSFFASRAVARLSGLIPTSSAPLASSCRHIQIERKPTKPVEMALYETVEKGAKNSPSYSLYFSE